MDGQITAHSIAGALDPLPGDSPSESNAGTATPNSPIDGLQLSLYGSARSGLGGGASMNPLSARTTPTHALVPCRCGADPPNWQMLGEMACGDGSRPSQPLN